MKRCFKIRCCPASCYLICRALKDGTNCWEEADVPCCKHNNKDRCKDCQVYTAAFEE